MTRRMLLTFHVVLGWLWFGLGIATAQPGGETPRRALTGFFAATRSAEHQRAAAFLELDDHTRGRGPELARRLKAVLDRHVWLEPARVDDTPAGNQVDGRPLEIEELATLPGPAGNEPVTLVRGTDGTWRFSAAVVARVDAWYARLPDRWLHDRLPGWLLRAGPLELSWWQWLALPVLVLVSFLFGAVLGGLTRFVLARVTRRTRATWDDELLVVVAGPLRWAWTLVLFRGLVELLALYTPAERTIGGLVRALLFLCFFWTLIRALDAARHSVAATTWATEKPIARALVPLAVRVGKVVVGIIALISMLSELGYPVAGLIAGLGIGGIAIALAAQKTVENLFGAFSIGLDQPFREGDAVKINEHVGVVEAIGLRSTRIRTGDRTVVTIPNAQVADARIESFAERDRLKLALKIGLIYATSGAALRGVLDGLRTALRDHPLIWDQQIDVRFVGFGVSALEIEVSAWSTSTDMDGFRALREQLLMTFMEIVDHHGSALALPSQTVFVESVVREKPVPARA